LREIHRVAFGINGKSLGADASFIRHLTDEQDFVRPLPFNPRDEGRSIFEYQRIHAPDGLSPVNPDNIAECGPCIMGESDIHRSNIAGSREPSHDDPITACSD
jgi:hypothetical protein